MRWTEEEKQYLRDNYEKTSAKILSKKLNRTANAICVRANSMGLKKSTALQKHEGEIRKLISEGNTVKQVALKLDLTYESLRKFCIRRRIEMPLRPNDFNLKAMKAGLEDPPEGKINRNTLTLREWFKRWYHAYRRENKSEATKQGYRIVYGQLIAADLGSMLMKKITRKDIQAYMTNYGRTHAKQTVLDHMQMIRSCFKDAHVDGHIKLNSAVNIQLYYTDQKLTRKELQAKRNEKKSLEADEYRKVESSLSFWLNNQLEKPPVSKNGMKEHALQIYYTMIYVALKTGARFGEILGLTREDVSMESINIDKTWGYKPRATDGFEPTKNISSMRTVYVGQEVNDLLVKYMDWLDKNNYEMNSNTLFIQQGRRVHNETVNSHLEDLLKMLGIKRLTMHKLRHTQASYLIAEGVPIQVVAKRLGHTDTNMVQTIYGHLLQETEHKGNEIIAGLI